MNWGTKIAIVYSIFAVTMISATVYCSHQDIHLVTEDYYAQELIYESHIQKVKNAQSLDTPMQINFRPENKELRLKFPQEHANRLTGSANFYRPSNARLDRTFALNTRGEEQIFSTVDLKSGLWRVKVEWEVNGERYFQEKSIFVQ